MPEHDLSGPEFIAVALQVSVTGVNRCPDAASSRVRIAENIARIEGYATTASNFCEWFYGAPVRLVALPEYAVTGFPLKETPAEWREKACLAYEGPEYEALGKVAQDNDIYLAGNVYEVDPNFPELYFQVCFIIDPSGDVILRYRRLTSSFEPTPHDVWDKYLDIYGLDGVFPVAKTEIGNLAMIASEEILYPEFARMHVMRGAEVIIHPTSEPGSPQAHCQGDCPTRACRREHGVCRFGKLGQHRQTFQFRPIRAVRCQKSSTCMERSWPRQDRAVRACRQMPCSILKGIEAGPGGGIGMANIMSRQAYGLFADSYAQADFHRANFLLARR